MEFYENQFFHVYNQGNNRRKIFFSRSNYLYFLLKIGTYISPFAHIIGYCLMPNHFHLLIYVHTTHVTRSFFKDFSDGYLSNYYETKKLPRKGYRSNVMVWKSSEISLNDAIAILQRSYTRAVNNEKNWSGSLFRSRCKAKDGWESKFITVGNPNFFTGNLYVTKCLEYIHNNPVEGGLVNAPNEWEFSSYNEYFGSTDFGVCTTKIGKRLLNQFMQSPDDLK